MSKISEQKALEVYPRETYYDRDVCDYVDINAVKRDGYIEGYDQAMQDFIEKACVSFCKQCPWKCKYDITQGEYCKNLHDFKQNIDTRIKTK